MPVTTNKSLRNDNETPPALQPAAPAWCATFDAISDIICLISTDHDILEMNAAGLAASGLSRSEVVGRKCFQVLHGASAPLAACPCALVATTGKPATQVHQQDGRFYELSAWPVLDPSGAVAAFVHVMKEVTERKCAEEERALFRALVDQSADIIEVVDPETGRFLDVNERGCSELGYTRAEYLGLRVVDVDPVVEEPGFDRVVRELRAAGNLRWEGVHRRKDGSTFPVEVGLRYARYARDYVIAVVRDSSERKRTGEALQRSLETQEAIASVLRLSLEDCPLDELLQRVLDVVLSARSLSLQRKGAILLVQEAGQLVMRAQLGLPEEIRHRCARVRFGECLCGLSASSGQVVHASRVDERHVHTHPGMQPHGHYCVPISYGGQVYGVLNTYVAEGHAPAQHEVEFLEAVADALAGILARRTAEEERSRLADELRQAQKLDALGRLAGGVAHDFNNLLTVITSCASFARDQLHESDPVGQDLVEILEASARAASLTRQLLAFGRKQAIDPKPLALNALISSMGGMLRRLIRADIAVELQLADHLGCVRADRGQLEQVVMNLVVNARDAMPHGGVVTLETSNVEIVEGTPTGWPGIPPGSYVVLAVRDTGCGMDDETTRRVFEPFYTTKIEGQGSGLGLSTVYGIVKQNHGDICVESQPGGGTTFRAILPRCEADDAKVELRAASVPPGGGETVLIVDDDSAVRRQVGRILRASGFCVLAAADGAEALLLWERHRRQIALVLTDVVMPLMSGTALAARLMADEPSLRVLYMSGYADEPMSPESALTSRIEKPFSASTLRRCVNELLERDRS